MVVVGKVVIIVKVSSTDFQNAVGRYLALLEKEDVIITKNGRSIAKLTAFKDHADFFVQEIQGEYKCRRRVSYEEYLELVNSSDQRYELIDGEVYLLASPNFRHQEIVLEIYSHFRQHLAGKSCKALTAPLDIELFGWATKFSEDPNVVQPDVMIICDLEKINKNGKYEGVPALLVEVLSPSTKGRDLVIKLNLYMRSGIREYWVVDPDKNTITQYSFSEEREPVFIDTFRQHEILQSTVFPEMTLKLASLFGTVE